MAKLIEDPNTVYLLAGDAGFAQLRFRLSAWTGVEDCWLEDVFVRESARGTGLGRALVEAALDGRARAAAGGSSSTSSPTTRGARALYESCGFSSTPKGAVPTFFMSRRLE